MTQHKSEDYKLSAVKYYLISDDAQENVCKIFKCSVRSLLRWVYRYKTEGEIIRHDRFPVAYKVSKKHVKYILEELTKNKTITLEDLIIKLKTKFKKLSISKMHLHRIIKDNNITLKLTRLRHEPIKRFGKKINIKSKLKEFYEEISKYKLKDIISIDETSINALQKRNHCYNEIGKRCVIKTHSQEVFKKYTCIFAINNKGVIGWKLYRKGGIDTDRLKHFLKKHITRKYKNKLIILDNASSHRNEKIKKLINKKNNLLYTIPYQHFTNTIEGFFNILKSRLQKLEGLVYDELKDNIKKVIKDIPKEYYKNIFKGSYDRKLKYIKKINSRKKKLKNYL
jgi:transposase